MGRNKSLYPLLIVLFLCLAPVIAICAKAEVSGDFTYRIVDGAAIITKYNGNDAQVIVPSSLGGSPVTQIGEGVFADRDMIETVVTLPQSVLVIGEGAFRHSGVTAINLPGGLTNIGASAFEYCEALKEIRIPASVTSIGYMAFHMSSLQAIQVEPDNKMYFSLEGVLYNKAQTSLIAYPVGKREDDFAIPQSVSVIGDYAFDGCSLSEITLPESVTHIGDSAFEFCPNLKSLFIPANVKSMGNWALSGCLNLDSISVSADNPAFTAVDDVLYDKAMTKLIVYPAKKADKDFAVPGTVEQIDHMAFMGTEALESITLPDGLESIGVNAFSACRSLTGITIPDSMAFIDMYAFNECKNLISVKLPEDITAIREGTFCYCTALTTVSIPDGVTAIHNSAFSYCDALKSITIPDSVTSIGDQVFAGCGLLTIHGVPGSTAQTYADANGIPFQGI